MGTGWGEVWRGGMDSMGTGWGRGLEGRYGQYGDRVGEIVRNGYRECSGEMGTKTEKIWGTEE